MNLPSNCTTSLTNAICDPPVLNNLKQSLNLASGHTNKNERPNISIKFLTITWSSGSTKIRSLTIYKWVYNNNNNNNKNNKNNNEIYLIINQ